jgi:hypothetical protein
VIGRTGDKYRVSDGYHPEIAKSQNLRKEGATGSMAPKSLCLSCKCAAEIDFRKGYGIKDTIFYMLKIPMPFLGVKGIRRFADKIVQWPKYARDIEELAHEIFRINVMLEDQGTGGGGFRYIYASFLREAGMLMNAPDLLELSRRMMEIGDSWREISLYSSRMAKNRDLGTVN